MPIKLSGGRPGGIVRHGKDWTYCLVLPNGHPSFSMPALDLYEKIHLAMFRCLKAQELSASLKPCPELRQKGIPGDCFREPVARDLMTEDGSQKIAGAAMKRTRAGVLVQGSMDLAILPALDEEKFFSAFVDEVSVLSASHPNTWIGRLNSPRGVVLSKKNSLLWPG